MTFVVVHRPYKVTIDILIRIIMQPQKKKKKEKHGLKLNEYIS